MLLSRVIVSPDVLYTCLSHALSTEHQEIMGLLLGTLINNNTEAFVQRSMVLSRKDKKKDRVEVSYADLGLASTVAEDLSLRVVGWYHSHPHITVLPSHVDVKTQGQYQALGNFLGLIFSVFDKGQLEMCAFQSRQNRNGDWERVEAPVIVSKSHGSINPILQSEKKLLESLLAMQLVLMNEDKETLSITLSHHVHDCSYLNISRTLSVYQASMFRLLDLQVCPLLMAMKSKISTLQYERNLLLRELDALSAEDKQTTKKAAEKDGVVIVKSFTALESAADSREESDKALRALETTIPKWTSSSRALRIAFAGISAEIVLADIERNMSDSLLAGPLSILKGDRCVVKVKRLDASSSSSMKFPWALEFAIDKAETKKAFPLLAVLQSHESSSVDFTILHKKPSSVRNGASKASSEAEAYLRVRVSIKILESTDGNSSRECASIIGENLNCSLHLNLLKL
jgi:BRCA1/BRCA2-containing complex subunit 3